MPETASADPSSALKVLLVEDNETVAATLCAGLRREEMTVEVATTGASARTLKTWFRPDVVLVDLGLPDVNGFDLVKEFGRDGECGVIVVTANDAESSRVMGLDTGADDYIVKPPALRELAARVRALHRRLTRADASRPEPTSLRADDPPQVTLDSNRRYLVDADGGRTPLTEAEVLALDLLLDSNGTSVGRAQLSEVALKRPLHDDDRSVDQLVLKLRRKLATRGLPERVILSARREGYVVPDFRLFRRAPR